MDISCGLWVTLIFVYFLSFFAVLLSDDFLDLLDIKGQHFLDAALEGRARRGTSCTSSNHLNLQYSATLIKRDELDIPAVFLHVRPDPVRDYFLDKLHHLRIVGIDIVAF